MSTVHNNENAGGRYDAPEGEQLSLYSVKFDATVHHFTQYEIAAPPDVTREELEEIVQQLAEDDLYPDNGDGSYGEPMDSDGFDDVYIKISPPRPLQPAEAEGAVFVSRNAQGHLVTRNRQGDAGPATTH